MTTEIFYPCGLFHISAPSDCLLKADTLFVGEQSYLWQACCMYCGHLFKLDDVRSSLTTDLAEHEFLLCPGAEEANNNLCG